mmetsp:Transcript_78971/g.229361  ORF Transcript_78971/g.229361 Transcript_78971/m.229361 type:complete len:81 (-) Transcript_78971:9-251(-)
MILSFMLRVMDAGIEGLMKALLVAAAAKRIATVKRFMVILCWNSCLSELCAEACATIDDEKEVMLGGLVSGVRIASCRTI